MPIHFGSFTCTMGHTDVLPFLLGERKRESAKPAEICIAPCDKAAEPSPCSSHSTEVGENKLRDFSRANSFESEEPLSYLSKEARSDSFEASFTPSYLVTSLRANDIDSLRELVSRITPFAYHP